MPAGNLWFANVALRPSHEETLDDMTLTVEPLVVRMRLFGLLLRRNGRL